MDIYHDCMETDNFLRIYFLKEMKLSFLYLYTLEKIDLFYFEKSDKS